MATAEPVYVIIAGSHYHSTMSAALIAYLRSNDTVCVTDTSVTAYPFKSYPDEILFSAAKMTSVQYVEDIGSTQSRDHWPIVQRMRHPVMRPYRSVIITRRQGQTQDRVRNKRKSYIKSLKRRL